VKKFLFIASLASALIAGLAGAQQQTRIVVGTGTTGGSFAWYGSNMTTLISRSSNLNITAQQTGGSYDNLLLLRDNTDAAKGTFYCGLATVDSAYASYLGQEPRFKDKKFETMRTMFYAYASFLHIVTSDTTDIKVLQNLKGKRISLGPAGSGNENLARLVLRGAGMDIENDFNEVKRMPHADAAKELANGNLDAYFILSGTPTSSIDELSKALQTTGRKLVFVPIDSSSTVAQRALQRFPGILETATLSKDVYKSEGSVRGLKTGNVFVCPASMPDDLAYNVTKLVLDNVKDLQKVVPSANETTAQASAKLVTSRFVVPMHPGAMRYFKEIKALR
jgi:uncharacterized protein